MIDSTLLTTLTCGVVKRWRGASREGVFLERTLEDTLPDVSLRD